MTESFTSQQEARIRELACEMAAKMIGAALKGADERMRRRIDGSVVLLPVVHADRSSADAPAASSGKKREFSRFATIADVKQMIEQALDDYSNTEVTLP